MPMREKLKTVAATSVVWIISLSLLNACADGLVVKTWYLAAKDFGYLIRKNPDGSIAEKKSFDDADGYLCYSPSDDEAWRNRLTVAVQCCNAKPSGVTLHDLTPRRESVVKAEGPLVLHL